MGRRNEDPHEHIRRKTLEADEKWNDPWLRATLRLRLLVRKERDSFFRAQLNGDCDKFVDAIMQGVREMVENLVADGPYGALAPLESRTCRICGEIQNRLGKCSDEGCKGNG